MSNQARMHRRQPPSARNAANPSGNEAASFNTPLSDLTAFWFSAMAAIKTIAPSPTSVEPDGATTEPW